MHPFVATVLLWGSRLDEVGQDAELDPPDRELRQSTQRHGGERHAVIGADAVRQPELVEESVEDLPGAGVRRP